MAKPLRSKLPVKQPDPDLEELVMDPPKPISDDAISELEDNATRLAYESRDIALQKLQRVAGNSSDPYVLSNIIAVAQAVINRPKATGATANAGFFEQLNEQLKVKVETKTIEITYQKIPTSHEKKNKVIRNSSKPTKRTGTDRKHVGGDKRKV